MNFSFFIAECMEFKNLGEVYQVYFLEDAIAIYNKIPAERLNGIKGIGLIDPDNEDILVDFFCGGEVDDSLVHSFYPEDSIYREEADKILNRARALLNQ